jgi:hypothetical protein
MTNLSKKIRYLSKVLLGITCTKNKSITTINEVYLPPITGENTPTSTRENQPPNFLLRITPIENKSILVTTKLYLPPIIGENILSS